MQLVESGDTVYPKVNLSEIVISCYFGDADGYATHVLRVHDSDLATKIVEVMMVAMQFDGRGGCSMVFDQANYFCSTTDSHWSWLSHYHGFPYDYDRGQNYAVDNLTVIRYDDHGVGHSFIVTDFDDFEVDMRALNAKYNLTSLYDITTAEFLKLCADYRVDALALLNKYAATVSI